MGEPHIGVDEAGKGDFFGPLVIAAVFVSPEQEPALAGIKEGKKLKDEECLRWDSVVKAACPHSVVAIGPSKFNELFGKVRHLNTIISWAQARAIENLLEKASCNRVSAERFADPEGLLRHLGEKGMTIELNPESKPGADLAVTAASVVSRAEFIRRLAALSKKFETQLPKGANWNAAESGAEIVKKFGKDALKETSKVNFRTVQEVFRKARS